MAFITRIALPRNPLASRRGIFIMAKIPHEDKAERIETTRSLLAIGSSDGEIKRAVSAKYKCSPRSVERYIKDARKLLLEATQQSADEHRAGAFAFYSHMKLNAARDCDKIRAQERIDKLLGIELPQKIEHSTAKGSPLEIVLAPLLSKTDSELDAIISDQQAANGNASDTTDDDESE